jgi:hypothetical protein
MEEEKEFTFEVERTSICYGIVIAKTIEEAKEKIKNGDYDDIIDTWDTSYDWKNAIIEEEKK